METRFEGQLKKGVLGMLVLGLVAEKASYGYELILRLRGQSGGLLDLKEGTLYPILYRLEDDGQLTSSWTKPPEDAPPAPRGPMPWKRRTGRVATKRAPSPGRITHRPSGLFWSLAILARNLL